MQTEYKRTTTLEKCVSLDTAKRLHEAGYDLISDNIWNYGSVPKDESLSYEDALDLVNDGGKTEEEVFVRQWQLDNVAYRNGDWDEDGAEVSVYAAPFVTDVQDWLRGKYGIFANAVSEVIDGTVLYVPVIERTDFKCNNRFETYYSALDHAILCALDYVGSDQTTVNDSYIVIVDNDGSVQRLKVRKAIRLETDCGRVINLADIEDDTYAIQIDNKANNCPPITFRLTYRTMSVFLASVLVFDEKFSEQIMGAFRTYIEEGKGQAEVSVFNQTNKEDEA